MKKFFILLFVLSVNIAAAQTTDSWTLKQDKDGVKIYTADVQDSKIKALKVESEFNATPSAVVAAVMDIKGSKRWIYSTQTAYVIKRSSPSDIYYYSLIKMPWPVANRDFVGHLVVKQDPATKAVTINGSCVAGMVPKKGKTVRVLNSPAQWLITPEGAKRVKIIYTLHADPGGSIPSGLVNMFNTKAPSQTFKKLRVELKRPQYKNAKLGYVKN
ncbi:MAG TPA: START domain-containing protein [Mucilaginibacter sp.]|jgi:hypothetical protein|nr:START domain-containing protein [Mucilaginibacter sp.]